VPSALRPPCVYNDLGISAATLEAEEIFRATAATAGGRSTNTPTTRAPAKQARELAKAVKTWLATSTAEDDKNRCQELLRELDANKRELMTPRGRPRRESLITGTLALAGQSGTYDTFSTRTKGQVLRALHESNYPSAAPAADDGDDAVEDAAAADDGDDAVEDAAAADDGDDAVEDAAAADDDDDDADDKGAAPAAGSTLIGRTRTTSERSPHLFARSAARVSHDDTAGQRLEDTFEGTFEGTKTTPMDDDTANQDISEGTHRPSARRRSSRLSGHNFFIMKHAPQYQEMFHQPGDKRKRWHVYGFFFETNLGSTTECAADEVSFEDAWGKKEAGGPDWFLCDDTNIWPPDGG